MNPFKYNDPTGHCASYSSIGDEPKPKPGDGDCWGLVDHILGLWARDQSGYWQQRWVSQDIFRKHVAATPSNDSSFMLQEINLYWHSETYQQWAQQQPNVMSTTSSGDLMCGSDPACQAVVQSSGQAVQYCTDNDCVVQLLDTVSTSAAGLAALCAAGIVTAPCSIPAVSISVAAGGAGTVWTGYQVWQGNGHEIDLATAAMTFTVGVKSNPYVGFVASLYQTYWDFRRPPPTNNQ